MLRLTDFIIDCPDPMRLVAFYSAVTGREVKSTANDRWAGIQCGEVELAFQRVDEYVPPTWPSAEHPKQFHLDFEVDDVEGERRRVIELGATFVRDNIDEEGYGWQVFTDPIGHPFCLCHNKGVTWRDGVPIWGA